MTSEKQRKIIILTVTNDLNQDQRMHRICSSFIEYGFETLLVGRKKDTSPELLQFPFKQKRLHCIFNSGFLFYAEFNIRLFVFLLFSKVDYIYSVDLDTIAPGGLAAKIRHKKQIFDAHEYFTETPELLQRKMVRRIWAAIASLFVPMADRHITVNRSLADIFSKKYHCHFDVIYNVPILGEKEVSNDQIVKRPSLLYQGMLNKGRGLELIIETMPLLPGVDLVIIGEGDLSDYLRKKAQNSSAGERIHFKGWLNPVEIRKHTSSATLGINLLDGSSISYYYSLANKFFDYMHAGLPSVNMDFPEYHHINAEYEVGVLLDKLESSTLADLINKTISSNESLQRMHLSCLKARQFYHWKLEKQKLHKIIAEL